MGKLLRDSYKDDDDLEDQVRSLKNSRLGDDFPSPPEFSRKSSPSRGDKNKKEKE